MDVLVTGGSLFVSAAIVRHFAALGDHVSVLNRGNRRSAGANEQITVDRNDSDAVRTALRDRRFDLVVDATCYHRRQAEILIQAVEGRARRIVMISSASVYRERSSSPPNPS
ncbi:NAD-dependent epimerase/dehydratase family protein [Novosphingobium sp. Rr 2-17]|uniref:NAD-dependent epimerase/dehydratase family protein n=1 Tax=Novosphingobium sp. Rr 2-17 TaxID=555793 RepID=UPI0012F6FA39